MPDPDLATLLDRLQAALTAEVAPAVHDAAAAAQLAAATAVLRRLARSWVSYGPWQALDEADYLAHLDELRGISSTWLDRILAGAAPPSGPALAALMIAIEADARTGADLTPAARAEVLHRFGALHLRLSERAAAAIGIRDRGRNGG